MNVKPGRSTEHRVCSIMHGSYQSNQAYMLTATATTALLSKESPADARITRDSAVIPRWQSAAILDIIAPEIAPFDPPTPKTLA